MFNLDSEDEKDNDVCDPVHNLENNTTAYACQKSWNSCDSNVDSPENKMNKNSERVIQVLNYLRQIVPFVFFIRKMDCLFEFSNKCNLAFVFSASSPFINTRIGYNFFFIFAIKT